MTFTLTDFEDNVVSVGSYVADANALDHIVGYVTGIGEWEGEPDEEGKMVGIPPYVTVQWDNGEKKSYPTTEWEFTPDFPFFEPTAGKVEDFVLLVDPRNKEENK